MYPLFVMKIQITKSLFGPDGELEKGSIVEMEEERAIKLIAAYVAKEYLPAAALAVTKPKLEKADFRRKFLGKNDADEGEDNDSYSGKVRSL